MERKIKILRSKDARTSRKLQEGAFEYMGPKMAEKVKARLRAES
jgi:hypothetical protein